MEEKRFYTIGEAVKELQQEFPELSISKVRFLEDRGLVKPYRTSGGYRKFSLADLEKLRILLRLQKEKYMPLEVIREKLRDFDLSGQNTEQIFSEDVLGGMEAGQKDIPSIIALADAPDKLGVPAEDLNELISYGIINPEETETGPMLHAADIQLIALSKDLSRFGIYPKHLRMYLNYTEKEVELFRQILLPILNQRSSEGHRRAEALVDELLQYSKQLKHLLLKTSLEDFLSRH